ncbi:MAG: response regulator transcription factor [Xylophilus ampelinus]
MWRCLVIEDDADNARYIADGLREHGHVAVVCRDGAEGLRRASAEDWDAIVLDRMLPGGIDGLAILATLRQLGKRTPVLVLSALSALDERVRGLNAGGDDYLTKPFAFAELIARLEALLRRSRTGPELRELQVADLHLDLVRRSARRGSRALALQPREFRLLAFLMAHAGQAVTRTMLLESVWDYHFDPQTNVIDVQISRLRQKVDAGAATPLIHTLRGVGYLLSETGEPGDPA